MAITYKCFRKKTNKEHDTGVFKFLEKVDRIPTRKSFLANLGYSDDQLDKVQLFTSLLVFPFENYNEVAVALFKSALRIKKNETQRLDAVIGEKNFRVSFFMYGSPLPDVLWFVDGVPIGEKDINYRSVYRSPYVFDLYIKEIRKPNTITIQGNRFLDDGKLDTKSESVTIKTYEPLRWSPSLSLPSKKIITTFGNKLTLFCSVPRKGLHRTAEVKIEWFDGSGEFFNGWYNCDSDCTKKEQDTNFKIERREMVHNDGFVDTSALTIGVIKRVEDTISCRATLEVNGFQLQKLSHNFAVAFGEKPAKPVEFKFEEKSKAADNFSRFTWKAERQLDDESFEDVFEVAEVFKETENRPLKWEVFEFKKETYASGMVAIILPLQDIKWGLSELPGGSIFHFRLYTKNKFGKGDYAENIIEIRTEDVEPTRPFSDVKIGKDSGSSEVVVSWDKYPRVAYGSYKKDECCIHVTVEITTPAEGYREKTLNCIEPELTKIKTGLKDTTPYTTPKVTMWFTNYIGGTNPQVVEGYNDEKVPKKPTLTDEQPEPKPKEIAVEFKAMDDNDVKGEFIGYQLIIRNDDGKIFGQKQLEDQGEPGDSLSITVDNLTPYKNYTKELIVKNGNFYSTSGEIAAFTSADKPDTIDPESIVARMNPKEVMIFWEPPDSINGNFKEFIVTFPDLDYAGNSTKEPFYNATDYFIRDGNPIEERGYPIEIRTKNHKFISYPAKAIVNFKVIKPGDKIKEDDVKSAQQSTEGFLSLSLIVVSSLTSFHLLS